MCIAAIYILLTDTCDFNDYFDLHVLEWYLFGSDCMNNEEKIQMMQIRWSIDKAYGIL
jgi:hypothetical protein